MKIETSEARDTLKHIGKHIKNHKEHGLIYSADLVKSLEMADAALEKQIPKEPIRKERTLEGGAITYWHICPSCKNRGLLDRWHRQLKHCPHCGQALKWSD
jgi:transcription initiation factor IIE alpha subunit